MTDSHRPWNLRRFGLATVCAAAPLILAAAVFGQTTAPARGTSQPLDARQQEVRTRLERLEDRMLRLAQLLAETEPDKADRLRSAIELASKGRLKARVAELVTLLRAGQYADAEPRQQTVLGDLDAVLKVLIDTTGDLDRKRQERERLEAARKAVREVLQEQLGHLRQTQESMADLALINALRESADEIERLAQDQSDQRATLEREPASPVAEQVAAERDLERRAMELAARLAKLAAEQVDESRRAAEDAAEETQAAADEMKKATELIEAGARPAAGASAKRAEERLHAAVERLRTEADRLGERKRTREIERLQRETERKASNAQQQMQEDRGAGRKAVPGSENVGKSRGNMQKAADRLGEDAPDQAQPEQEQAADELQKALDEIDASLRQLRREEMEETLAALESRLRAMLAREEGVLASVQSLDEKGPAKWGRTEQLQLAETAKTQNEVAEECASVHRILVQEGTTIVFPEIMAQLQQDVTAVGRRLQDADTSAATQAQLADVITVLKDLLAAVEAQRDRQRQQQQNSEENDQPNADAQPLVPGSAELKLLRTRQIIVRRQTESLGSESALPAETRKLRFTELSGNQRQLSELAKRMNERQP